MSKTLNDVEQEALEALSVKFTSLRENSTSNAGEHLAACQALSTLAHMPKDIPAINEDDDFVIMVVDEDGNIEIVSEEDLEVGAPSVTTKKKVRR